MVRQFVFLLAPGRRWAGSQTRPHDMLNELVTSRALQVQQHLRVCLTRGDVVTSWFS